MSYPSFEEYTDTLRLPPGAVFLDPVLATGSVRKNAAGVPFARSGNFALTYEVSVNGSRYAVRCFHKESDSLERRYEAIARKLKAIASPWFMDFEFQPAGIRTESGVFPIVRMPWADGCSLAEFILEHREEPQTLLQLRDTLRELARHLQAHDIAHGDIQPGNIVVRSATDLKLVDYDGMFVPELEPWGSTELGQRNFQHPGRSWLHYDERLDRFSFALLDVVLEALAMHPALWELTSSDEASIVLRASDFADPASSTAFGVLAELDGLGVRARQLAAVCKSPFERVPALDDFLAGRRIPATASANLTSASVLAKPAYIPAYAVLNATNFARCCAHIGDRIELIGRVRRVVREGPHDPGHASLRVEFGYAREDMVRLAIWPDVGGSEFDDLAALEPGQWLSAIGLVDPILTGTSGDQAHKSVSIAITEPSQLRLLSEVEALHRLAANLEASRSHPDVSVTIGTDPAIPGVHSRDPPPAAPATLAVDASHATLTVVLPQVLTPPPTTSAPDAAPAAPAPVAVVSSPVVTTPIVTPRPMTTPWVLTSEVTAPAATSPTVSASPVVASPGMPSPVSDATVRRAPLAPAPATTRPIPAPAGHAASTPNAHSATSLASVPRPTPPRAQAPAAHPKSARQPRSGIDWRLRWPTIRLPPIHWPSFRLPPIHWPSFRLPPIHWPSFRLPPIHWPSFRLPPIHWPSFRLPPIHWPSFRLPPMRWTEFRLPAIRWPTMQWPTRSSVAARSASLDRLLVELSSRWSALRQWFAARPHHRFVNPMPQLRAVLAKVPITAGLPARLRAVHPAWWLAAALMTIVLVQSWIIAHQPDTAVTVESSPDTSTQVPASAVANPQEPGPEPAVRERPSTTPPRKIAGTSNVPATTVSSTAAIDTRGLSARQGPRLLAFEDLRLARRPIATIAGPINIVTRPGPPPVSVVTVGGKGLDLSRAESIVLAHRSVYSDREVIVGFTDCANATSTCERKEPFWLLLRKSAAPVLKRSAGLRANQSAGAVTTAASGVHVDLGLWDGVRQTATLTSFDDVYLTRVKEPPKPLAGVECREVAAALESCAASRECSSYDEIIRSVPPARMQTLKRLFHETTGLNAAMFRTVCIRSCELGLTPTSGMVRREVCGGAAVQQWSRVTLDRDSG